MPIKKTVMNKTDIYGIETCSYVYRDVGSKHEKQNNMTKLDKILITVILILISISCSMTNRISDEEIEKRALIIADSFDSTNIDRFKTWDYVARGIAGFWLRNSGDSSLYSCVYFDFGDSTILSVTNQEDFLKDFEINLPYDTAYWRISFNKQPDNLIRIIGVNNHGRDIIIKDKLSPDSIFNSIDPFETFSELTDLKDSLKIIGIKNYVRLGGFIQFYLSAYHVLTYIPDIDSLNPKYKQIWIKEFDKGRMINKHWNLRKLEKPIDNG